jgi:predicted metalloprotease
MTFNEGMQIDTSNISAGGRGPGRGIAIGGGLGGLVIVVIALFLGVDPSTVVPQQEQIGTGGVEAPGYDLSHCKTGADANKYVECRVVATTNSVDGVWQHRCLGTLRRIPAVSRSVQTGCGPGQ